MKGLKPLVFVLCLLPLAYIVAAVLTDNATANPVEYAIRSLGDWAFRFLLIALAITPVRKFTGWQRLATLRRMLGLFAFTYVTLHLVCFWGADLLFSPAALWKEVVKRPYITFGMIAFVILIPLAVTSTDGMVRRLGGARWRALHKGVYAAGILAALHFYYMKASKSDVSEPLIYAAILAVLLGYRALDARGWAPRLPRKREARA